MIRKLTITLFEIRLLFCIAHCKENRGGSSEHPKDLLTYNHSLYSFILHEGVIRTTVYFNNCFNASCN